MGFIKTSNSEKNKEWNLISPSSLKGILKRAEKSLKKKH